MNSTTAAPLLLDSSNTAALPGGWGAGPEGGAAQLRAGGITPLGILRYSQSGSWGVEGALPLISAAALSLDDERAAARVRKFALLALARTLLPHRRVRFCLRGRTFPKKPVRVHGGDGRAYLGNLFRCGMPWLCPCCAPKIAEVKRAELEQLVKWARSAGYDVFLSTLTVSHGRGDALRSTLGALAGAYRAMVGSRAYKRLYEAYGLDGKLPAVKSLEVTVGDWHGWHPHLHVLHLVRAGVDRSAFERDLASLWVGALAPWGFTASQEHGVKVKQTRDAVDKYVAKWGRPWTYADELVKGHSKRGRGDRSLTPFDLLRKIAELPAGDHQRAQYVAWWREYDQAFFRARQLRWSPGLRAAVGLAQEQTDEALAAMFESEYFADMSLSEWLEAPEARAATADPDVLPLLAELDWQQWGAVLRYERRGQLLALACEGDAGKVRAFVRALVEHHRGEAEREAWQYPEAAVCLAESPGG